MVLAASGSSPHPIPNVCLSLNGIKCNALLDSGSGVNFICKKFIPWLEKTGTHVQIDKISVKLLDNSLVQSVGKVFCRVEMPSGKCFIECFHVMGKLCCDVIIGSETLARYPSLWKFSKTFISAAADLDKEFNFSAAAGRDKDTAQDFVVDDTDFLIRFIAAERKWTLTWKWSGRPPDCLIGSMCGEYSMPDSVRDAYEQEVNSWIEMGILIPYEPVKHGPVKGSLPLFSVVQQTKNKVRPVVDYRPLNIFLSSHTADAVICGEKLREWRRRGSSIALLDLRRAYLQCHVEPSLQVYQSVIFKGKTYLMTRLCFGISIGPKAMSHIVKHVLEKDNLIAAATDSYIDDIIVDESRVSADVVKKHLLDFGLESKDIERVSNDGNDMRVLGLRVFRDSNGVLLWQRSGDVPPNPEQLLTRRELFSLLGKLTGHYPVCGWLRVASSFLKRQAESSSNNWDDHVSSTVHGLCLELLERVRNNDPVHGTWSVPETNVAEVAVDASSLATGCCVVIAGQVVEDASWLRPRDDATHINVAELDAAVKGLNYAIKWGVKELTLTTDSSTVASWLRSTITRDHRIQTKGMSEMLVRRRLQLFGDLIAEYDMVVSVNLVPSHKNRADLLTRVPHVWLTKFKRVCEKTTCVPAMPAVQVPTTNMVKQIHDQHHLGTNRTLQFCRDAFPNAPVDDLRHMVVEVIKGCTPCAKIDPTAVKYPHGSTHVTLNWCRLCVDFVQFGNLIYLSVIDAASGFLIYRLAKNKSADAAERILQHIFLEWGPPSELLTDHQPFASEAFRAFCKVWGCGLVTRCANRPCGNPVERSHRTIKRMAARTGKSVEQMVFWYNRSVDDSGTSPLERLQTGWLRRVPNMCDESPPPEYPPGECPFSVGDPVFIKPTPSPTPCDRPWRGPFFITRVFDSVSAEAGGDGIRRHVSHLRKAPLQLSLPDKGPFRTENASNSGVSNTNIDVHGHDSMDTDLPRLDGIRTRSGREIKAPQKLDL